jgi:hypothetical protein
MIVSGNAGAKGVHRHGIADHYLDQVIGVVNGQTTP